MQHSSKQELLDFAHMYYNTKKLDWELMQDSVPQKDFKSFLFFHFGESLKNKDLVGLRSSEYETMANILLNIFNKEHSPLENSNNNNLEF